MPALGSSLKQVRKHQSLFVYLQERKEDVGWVRETLTLRLFLQASISKHHILGYHFMNPNSVHNLLLNLNDPFLLV